VPVMVVRRLYFCRAQTYHPRPPKEWFSALIGARYFICGQMFNDACAQCYIR
jgi:hypothetical protein